MKLDGHIHIFDGPVNTTQLLDQLSSAGYDGGLLISKAPACFPEYNQPAGCDERLDNLMQWTDPSEHLYPFFWIDPLEDDAAEQVRIACARSVQGFKVICSHHYPSDPRAMEIYRQIAAEDKPILFHSGILWDARPSAHFNKPVEFEPLMEIERLRFALAHVSWPWYDEAIAVYGKIEQAYRFNPELSCRMFIDTTPGTPVPYRQDVLTKIFTVGYDVENTVIFGSDCKTNDFDVAWLQEWTERDDAIYDQLQLSQTQRKNIYCRNLQRFLGLIQDN